MPHLPLSILMIFDNSLPVSSYCCLFWCRELKSRPQMHKRSRVPLNISLSNIKASEWVEEGSGNEQLLLFLELSNTEKLWILFSLKQQKHWLIIIYLLKFNRTDWHRDNAEINKSIWKRLWGLKKELECVKMDSTEGLAPCLIRCHRSWQNWIWKAIELRKTCTGVTESWLLMATASFRVMLCLQWCAF